MKSSLLIGGILFLVTGLTLFHYVGENATIVDTDCYDDKGHKIQGLVCEGYEIDENYTLIALIMMFIGAGGIAYFLINRNNGDNNE